MMVAGAYSAVTTSDGTAVLEDLGGNWARIIPQDGSMEYFWNRATQERQWEHPVNTSQAPPQQDAAYGFANQGQGYHHHQQQQGYMVQQQQPAQPNQRAQHQAQQRRGQQAAQAQHQSQAQQRQRMLAQQCQHQPQQQGRGHTGSHADKAAWGESADQRAQEWAAQQSSGGDVDALSIFVRNLDPKATNDEIRTFFGRFGKVRDVAHQHNFKRQSSGPAYAFIRYDRESSVSKALRTPTLTFKERT